MAWQGTGNELLRNIKNANCRWRGAADHSSRIRSTIFPSTCPSARRSCALAALINGNASAIGTLSFAASTAMLSLWMFDFRRNLHRPRPDCSLARLPAAIVGTCLPGGIRPMTVVRSLRIASDPNGCAGRNGRHANVERESMADFVAAVAKFRASGSWNRNWNPPRNAHAG